jgi:hypothetical protein
MAIRKINSRAIADGAVATADLGTNLDIAGTLDVTGVVTADSNMTVAGDFTVADKINLEPAERAGVNQIKSYNNGLSSYMEMHFDASSFRFYDAADGTYDSTTEALRVNSSGVSFDSGSNYLDDYEEGTYTVATNNANVTIDSTKTTQSYTKIGNQVTVRGQIKFTATNSTTGSIGFTLPFTPMAAPSNGNAIGMGPSMTHGADIGDAGMVAYCGASASYWYFYKIYDNGGWQALRPVDVTTSDTLNYILTYWTNA